MLIELQFEYLQMVLNILLQDKNSNKNIIWATDDYKKYGPEYFSDCEMTSYNVNALDINVLQPRVTKSKETQKGRTKEKAEVFTPSWICENMNTYCDLDWFDIRKKDKDGKTKFIFNDEKTLKKYISLRKLEITCGEAPFVISRYDTTTGNIISICKRIGFLDRKLIAINQYIENKEEWLKWVYKAYENSYGYEYQGDNLLKARINLFYTFIDYYEKKWKEFPMNSELKKIATIISRNFWQMDGLTYTVPMTEIECKVYNWRSKKNMSLIGDEIMKFDYIIGNPPYQKEKNETAWSGQIYNYFMDSAYKISDKTFLITPARFLFNAGKTPKEWNKKMLNDTHFKVLKYYEDSKSVFVNTAIEGGVAIHLYDNTSEFNPIGVFTTQEEIDSIVRKVSMNKEKLTFSDTIYPYSSYSFTTNLPIIFPELFEKLPNKRIIASNLFEKFENKLFFMDKPIDNQEYIRMLGRKDNERVFMWVNTNYIEKADNFEYYKVFVPAANGSTLFDNKASSIIGIPIVGKCNEGHNQTFISIGKFNTEKEAINCLNYLKTKFVRMLIGTLKVTQNGKKDVYLNVPIQDFTENSDIDWSKSIKEIDQQLYKKYSLDEKEIAFIEEKVKEME